MSILRSGIARDSTGVEPSGAPLDGPAFYDDKRVFERYQSIRTHTDAPNQTIEQPVVLEFLGDLQGRSLLDLGCGDAWIGRYALDAGASRYLGLDRSRRMLKAARRMLRGTTGEVRCQDLEEWRGSDTEVFDVVLSRLVLQYTQNLVRLLQVVHDQLRPGGLFVFSVEHPVMTSSYNGEIVDNIARAWRVQGYFQEGSRVDHWLDALVLKQHRTFETYISELRRCGFQLDQFSEGRPQISHFSDAGQYEARLEVPLCAVFRCIREA